MTTYPRFEITGEQMAKLRNAGVDVTPKGLYQDKPVIWVIRAGSLKHPYYSKTHTIKQIQKMLSEPIVP